MNGAIDFPRLWKHVTALNAHKLHSVHGPDHWRRVERNGLLLATRSGADVDVVRLFAIFHDSQRENDGTDPHHGQRGADLAKLLRGRLFDLADPRFDLLYTACVWHTDQTHHDDPTIGTCWDADRLDLGRVGMIPNPKYLNTEFARKIARHGTISAFL